MQIEGKRWLWPAIAGILAISIGEVSGWTQLQHVGLALFAVIVVSWISVVACISLISAHGASLLPAVMAGDRVTVRYVLRNRGIWPLAWILLEPQGFAALPVQPQYVGIGPRRERPIDVSLICPQRGYWVAGGWTMRASDPFGLFERTRTAPGLDQLLVYPKPIPLPGLHITAQSGSSSSRRGRPTQQASAAIREVRPYQPGDPPSRIHWLSSARLDRLVVKEPEGEPAAHAWLLLDLEESVQYGEAEGDSVELVVGSACTVLQQLQHRRLATGILIAGTSTVIYPQDRADSYERLLSTLAGATVGTQSAQQSIQALRSRGGYRPGSDRGTIVLITPWADERWAPLLAQWARSGSTVICVLVDTPDSDLNRVVNAQAERLRILGVQVYRHTAWVV